MRFLFALGGAQSSGVAALPLEEELVLEVHTPDHPYCSHLSCSCHVDVGYHDTVTAVDLGGEQDVEGVACARSFFGITWER